MKSAHLRMTPSTELASLKKIHLLFKSLVEYHFYFVYFSL